MTTPTPFEQAVIAKYDAYGASVPANDGLFMNDGFADFNSEGYPVVPSIPLKHGKYRKWKYQVNLYKAVLDTAGVSFETAQGSILDLSCGRGGGIAYYRDHYSFDRCFGIDINPAHIAICRRHAPNVDFRVGKATAITVDDDSIDIITSIEAFNYYGDSGRYVAECRRILTSNGLVIQAGPCSYESKDDVNRAFTSGGFAVVADVDVVANVRMACAISKFRCIDHDRYYYEAMAGDERRYSIRSAGYFISVYRRDPGGWAAVGRP